MVLNRILRLWSQSFVHEWRVMAQVQKGKIYIMTVWYCFGHLPTPHPCPSLYTLLPRLKHLTFRAGLVLREVGNLRRGLMLARLDICGAKDNFRREAGRDSCEFGFWSWGTGNIEDLCHLQPLPSMYQEQLPVNCRLPLEETRKRSILLCFLIQMPEGDPHLLKAEKDC